MHIVHVGKYYAPYRGGIETVVEQISAGLVHRDVEVTVVVSNDTSKASEEHLRGVRVIRLPRAAELSSQPINPLLVRTLRSLKMDLLHFHTPNPIGALAVLAARCTAPIVVTHHSDIVRQRLLGGAATAAHALLYRKARALIAPTPKHIEHSSILSRFPSLCRVIHLPIDVAPYANAQPLTDGQLPPGFANKPLALFVGRLVYYKGLDVLLDALSRVPDVCLMIVGVGPLRQALVAQTKELGLAQRVAFLDAVTPDTLLGLYKSASFFVLPSVARSEAFGMVQLESMAAARAVISTDLPSGVPYVNQHEKTGLIVKPCNPAALAAAMQRLVADPAYTLALGVNGEARAREAFAIEHIVEQHLSLYEELCGSAARPGSLRSTESARASESGAS